MERENYALLNTKIDEGKSKFETKSKEYDDTLATICEKWINEKTLLESKMKVIDDEIAELEEKVMGKRRYKQELEQSDRKSVV